MLDLASFCLWNRSPHQAKEGVLVAADCSQEWLLPWWWKHYQSHNDFPVTFVDLGLSASKKQWCKERGHYFLLPLPDIFVLEKEELSSEQIQRWEEIYGSSFWHSRNAWFKKPMACLQSPYQKTVWLDLDCQVRSCLRPLFNYAKEKNSLAIAKENSIHMQQEGLYNSGVLVFQKDNPLLEEWALLALKKNHLYPGDQDILSALLKEQTAVLEELPAIWNWSRSLENTPVVRIQHWHGPHGKQVIAHQMREW